MRKGQESINKKVIKSKIFKLLNIRLVNSVEIFTSLDYHIFLNFQLFDIELQFIELKYEFFDIYNLIIDMNIFLVEIDLIYLN